MLLLANQDDTSQLIAMVGFTVLFILIFGGLCLLIVKMHRKFVATSNRKQLQVYEGTHIFESPGPGLVQVTFHAYSGILVFTHQTEHQFWATPDDARTILARLNRFNLTWGFFAYGALIIPILSLGNYWAQRSRISKQAAAM